MAKRMVVFLCLVTMLISSISVAVAAPPQDDDATIMKSSFARDEVKVRAFGRLRMEQRKHGGEAFTNKEDLIQWISQLNTPDRDQLMDEVARLEEAPVYIIVPSSEVAALVRDADHGHEETYSSSSRTLSYTMAPSDWCPTCQDWRMFILFKIVDYAFAEIWKAILQCEGIKTCYMCHAEMSRYTFETVGSCPTCGITGRVTPLYYNSQYATYGCVCGEQFFVYP